MRIPKFAKRTARVLRWSRVGQFIAPDQRTMLAQRYLRGEGVEIGALYKPLKVHPSCSVKYVDRISRWQAIAAFPELNPREIVEPDILDDGFTLKTVPSESQDFLIANHVLEHSSDPLGTLRQWARVVRPQGLLFIALPLAEGCFDKGRDITSLDHLVEDELLHKQNLQDKLKGRDRKHYEEWVRISDPAIARERGLAVPKYSAAEFEEKVERLLEEKEEIHFHTFSVPSFQNLLRYLESSFSPTLRVLSFEHSRLEVFAILQRA